MIGNVLILLLAGFSMIYLSLCAYAHLVSDSMIFPVPHASYKDGPDIIKLKSATGESISAYFLEAPGAEIILLYSHGNGEDIGHTRPRLSEFHRRGISVFTYDYPGYGTSSGRPSEKGVYAAAEAAYLYLTQDRGVPPGQIILYGRSLGSGPSTWLAARYPVAGMILESAFSSTFRVLTRVKLLPFDKFDNLARLRDLDLPILLIHGKEDLAVPFEHALKNERVLRAGAETLWIEGGGHNNLVELSGDRYWNTVMPFIQKQSPTLK